MSSRDYRRVKYDIIAKRILLDCQLAHGLVDKPPVPFEHIAVEHIGVTYQGIDTTERFRKRVIAVGLPEDRCILFDKSCAESPMYGFTFCHELAHFVLHTGRTGTAHVNQRRIVTLADGERATKTEREADALAAALLMPEYLLR